MSEKYLDAFVRELSGYSERITALAAALRDGSDQEAIGAAARELARLFHTIAGLSGSLEVGDFADLAEGLEYIFTSLAAYPGGALAAPITPALANLLNLTTRYLNQRLAAMHASQQFSRPTSDDEGPRHILEETIWQLGSRLYPPGEELPQPAEQLTEADRAILRAFSESDLAEAANAPYPAVSASPDAAESPAQAALPEIGRSLAEGQAAETKGAQPSLDETIPPEMLRLFQAETQEDILAFQAALAHLETREDRAAAVLEMRHIAHKIKGAAATVNLQIIASLSHCLEDILDLLRSRRLDYIPAALEALIHGVAELEGALRRHIAGEPESSEGLERLRAEYEALLAAQEASQENDPGATQPDARTLAAAVRQQTAEAAGGFPNDLNVTPIDPLLEQPSWALGREHTLRVEVNKLDQLMSLVGELATNRASTDQVRRGINDALIEMRGTIQRLDQLIEQLDEQETARSKREHLAAQPTPGSVAPASAQEPPEANQQNGWLTLVSSLLPGNPSQSENAASDASNEQADALGLERFDSESAHLISAFREGVNDVATLSESIQNLLFRLNGLAQSQEALTSTIQRDITHLRLVPISQILPRLQLTARMVAQEQNKQINFQASGEATEIDREIIDAITGPVGQLVRNCVVHGIETPEERREQGKPEVGTISLRAYYSGNEASIEVSDDGRGINHHQLVAAALASGKITLEEADRLTPEQAANLMLLPDISTSPEVTTIAGRGVGMDMVRKAVESLKGTLHIHSRPGQGTTFHLRLPISLGILPALFVRVGQRSYAAPLMTVERILRQKDLPQQQDTISFFTLNELFNETLTDPVTSGQREAAAVSDSQAALMISLGHRQIGIFVDEVIGEREAVVKRLPPYLRRRGVRGVTPGPQGELLLLLDLPELVYHALGDSHAAQTPGASEPAPAAVESSAGSEVLVVDDSLFMRRTLEAQLTRAGYQVTAAKDGIEALQSILKRSPSLVLLDIEMPRLDGYELLRVLRSRAQFKGLPVAMLTSRAAEKHREYAMELGANAYLVKPCPQDMLLQTIAGLVNRV
jgi:chemosensory pili system protein ChpA (sensor histidine kinase/response regulator)